MRRISQEEVAGAYLAQGVAPARFDWQRCALGVLLRARGVPVTRNSCALAAVLGLRMSLPYAAGFAAGFDGRGLEGALGWLRAARTGWEDGRAAAGCVFAPQFQLRLWPRLTAGLEVHRAGLEAHPMDGAGRSYGLRDSSPAAIDRPACRARPRFGVRCRSGRAVRKAPS